MTQKVTWFVGYLSGDYECFCLSKVPFKKWVERHRKLSKIDIDADDGKQYAREYKKIRKLLLYPDYFFPKETKQGKWRFKITVEAEKVREVKGAQ